MPGVAECAVVGIPDDILGEAVAFFIVKNDLKIGKKDIMLFCKNNLASYKLPKTIEFVEHIPKTASGKIKRYQLKNMVFS